ncbi:MAG TPA: PhoH family protein [Rhodothermales bacterium]|nr:PhoH family protein [Rhodothermales bacterium]
MAEKRITVENAEPLLLFGFNDVYLRRIEVAFPDTQITARGTTVMLRGEPERIARIEQVLSELVVLLNRNGNLTENDVETVLALTALGDGERPSTALGARDAILFTPGGGVVRAKTPGQQQLVEKARRNDIVFAIGPAGTGKTYTAVALAVAALKSRQAKKIVLARPAVEAGERLGFLPGDLKDKIDPYLRPLYDALEDMMPRERLAASLQDGTIEIAPLAFMRGRTLNTSFVILDEAQNATVPQMKMFLTRLGAGSRAIVTGDATQTDLPSREMSGLAHARGILEGVEGIAVVEFNRSDVVRHRLVKDIIEAYERAGMMGEGG